MTTTAQIAPVTESNSAFYEEANAALDTASRLPDALLAGERGGDMPAGFDLTNSPAQLAARTDLSRPLVLLSSTGTRLMCGIRHRDAAYLACFRNYRATIDHLASNHDSVTLIGAGTRGEFREEDQMCCAWIADALQPGQPGAQGDGTRLSEVFQVLGEPLVLENRLESGLVEGPCLLQRLAEPQERHLQGPESQAVHRAGDGETMLFPQREIPLHPDGTDHPSALIDGSFDRSEPPG